MRKKGFTLIELLAVIVILAIIALIATPMVLKTIDDARRGAAIASAYAYEQEVEKYVLLSQLDPTKTQLQVGVKYQLSSTKYEIASLADPNEVFINDLINIKGDKPESGYVVIGSNGKISKLEMIINEYPIECIEDTCKIIDENKRDEEKEEEPEEEPEEEITYDNILQKAVSLVYDESGVCKTDGSTYNYMGGCYIKGSSTNNYVWYNGFVWRIMGINSDSTVRLITDDAVTTLVYGASNTALTYATNEGHIHDWLNEYFYNKLNSTKNIIQEGAYFCSQTTNNATLSTGREKCSSAKIVNAKIGLISYDEYLLANASSSYLNIGQSFWTMTPNNNSTVWHTNSNGATSTFGVSNPKGVRPVINVSSDSIITSGNGSAKTFYVLGEDKSSNITGTIGEMATSGEYVSLEGKTYRVVSKDSTGVKLIFDGFYSEATNGQAYQYGNNTNSFTQSLGIGKKLNGDVLTWLGLATSDKIVTSTWYQGDNIGTGNSYTNVLKQSNGVKAKVGLIQAGDILAGQSSTVLTKNYTKTSSASNVSTYWTLTRTSSTSIWLIFTDSTIASYDYKSSQGIRPVIVVRNDLNITGGNGTWTSPYQI